MGEDKAAFASLIIARRQDDFEELQRQRERRLEERRAQRRFEREIARREEFVRRCREAVADKVGG
jgi:translation initiation factor 3 subunit A